MTSQATLTLEPKLHPQLSADAQVPRTALLDLLEASSRTPVAAILAPPGYGKTTLLAQWAEHDPRAFGWLTLNRPCWCSTTSTCWRTGTAWTP
jgi:LuxR family maltose regulon positive regulatory protein